MNNPHSTQEKKPFDGKFLQGSGARGATVHQTNLPGVLLIEPHIWTDQRESFWESWNCEDYAQIDITKPFVQDNMVFSIKGVLHGLHYQFPHQQGKLVQVLVGEVFYVVVDIRFGSPTFGQWVGERLSEGKHSQLYIPPGLAHGHYVTSDTVLFHYKCTAFCWPAYQKGICWNDPDLDIQWPYDSPPMVSSKDNRLTTFRTILPINLPLF